ncbi:MAG: hypothetical protein J7L95_01035, partial [Prolixibacteraceae bacterium]|nr:hypothetical protein [Prolixibacteraceae bacterium]
ALYRAQMNYSNDLSQGVALCYDISDIQPDKLIRTSKAPLKKLFISTKNITNPVTKQCKIL